MNLNVLSTEPAAIDTANKPAYVLHNVTKRYGSGNGAVEALRGVELWVNPGEFVAIMGKSGSGKTTLLQLLGALDRPTGGQILCAGRDIAGMSDRELSRLRLETIGFIFQQFNLIPTLSARANIEIAMAPQRNRGGNRSQRARELLDSVGLGHRADHLPSQLSGGEQQRVAIARALANHPSILLADEPTGNLDSATGEDIMGLLRSLAEERGHTVIVVTHDPAIAHAASRVIRIRDGRIE